MNKKISSQSAPKQNNVKIILISSREVIIKSWYPPQTRRSNENLIRVSCSSWQCNGWLMPKGHCYS